MDPMDEVKRASLTLNERPENIDDDEKGPAPRDPFGFIGIVVTAIGLTSILATSFIVTANDYWMYKFRDPASETYNASNRTTLQTNFTPALGVAMAVPSVIGLILVVTVAQKIKARTRIIVSYIIITTCFLLFTIFVEIDTDDWQIEFFSVTMVKLAINSITFVILTSSLIVSVPRLPHIYLKLFMYGQGAAGIFSAVLQIISLAIGKTSTKVALIYFGSGTGLYFVSLILYMATKNVPFYQHYVNEKAEDTKAPRPSVSELLVTLKRMWPILAVMGLVVAGQTTTHPNITNLIVSKSYGDGSAWSETYFVPVITFLVADILNVIGRFFAKNIITPKNHYWFVAITFVRAIIFPILFAYCNVRTAGRTQEAFFNEDWHYIVILGVFVSTAGYFQTCAVLSLPNFKRKDDKMDLYYLMLQVMMTVIGLGSSPLGILVVNLL